jgi:two-component system chemotaxis sensor kinase CheA
VRLHKIFNIKTDVTEIQKGIITVIENDTKTICLFADRLLGEQQIVVKPLPGYLSKYNIEKSGVGGCSILGDGSISLILDTNGLINEVA